MRPVNGVDGEYRTRLFHAIRDLTADAYGGWHLVTNIQSGGGLYAQRHRHPQALRHGPRQGPGPQGRRAVERLTGRA